jgi:hypothetical protein
MRTALVGVLFASAIACLATTEAQAVVLYDQPGTASACAGFCWTSTFATNTNSGFATFDDFSLSTNANITSVSWRGFYWDQTGNNGGAQPGSFWEVFFFSDTGTGLPLNNLYQQVVTPTVTHLGSDTFNGDPVEVYSFSADLPVDFFADANTTYWFVPLSFQPDFNPLFSWSPSTALVDGYSVQQDISTNVLTVVPGDRAFSLFGTVPEPITISVFGGGLVGAVALRRRRRAGKIVYPRVGTTKIV